MVFETAVNGQADAIVTFNQKDFAMTAKRFSLALLPPAEALSLLEKEV
jgi:predicted nucleic acid-binding protein